MSNQTASRSTIWHAAAPNPFVGGCIATAILFEIAIVFSAAPSFRTTDLATQVFGTMYIVWFWSMTGLVMHLIGQNWIRFSRTTKARLAKITTTIVLSLAVLVYCVSWGLFFKTGRFANFEAVRFLAFNFRHLWDYISQAEPIHLVIAGCLVAATLVGIPRLLRAAGDSRWPSECNRTKYFAFCLGLTLIVFLSWRWIPVEPGSLRRANRRRAVAHELHPSFTVLISYLESTAEAQIVPSLDPTKLVRLRDFPSGSQHQNPNGNSYSVIFVAIESLRHDTIHQFHQGKEVLPNINRLAKHGMQLTQAYAQSTHSDYADVCLVSSLYPLRTRHHHYYDKSDPWPKTLIYDVLKSHGYSTAIISSQNELWGGMASFLDSPNLDFFYHPETANSDAVFQETSAMDRGFSQAQKLGTLKAGKFPDYHTTSQAITWIKKQVRQGRPYCLNMNLQSSHFPYFIPDTTDRPFQPCDLNSNISFSNYPKSETAKVKNAYFNAIHECDRQIGRLVNALNELGELDKTILVVTGENGEAFHECGSITHAREPVEPAIHVACVFHAPGLIESRQESYAFEHVDLVPTTLGLLGLQTHPNFQGIDIFSPDRRAPQQRLTFCHVNTCFAHCDAIMLAGRWKLVVDRTSGARTLHDTLDDPNEQQDLMNVEPELAERLGKELESWRRDQLSYYHFPQYYLHFFPPKPPAHFSGVAR